MVRSRKKDQWREAQSALPRERLPLYKAHLARAHMALG